MWMPLNKATITSTFYTDGDYSIDSYMMSVLRLEFDHGDREYIVGEVTYDKNSRESLDHNPWYAVRNYLTKLAVSFQVSHTHHYVLGDLFNMVDKLHDDLMNSYLHYDGTYHLHGSYGGNYEGTEIDIVMERDTEDDREKIDILPITPRIIKALNDGGIFTVKELCNVHTEDLLPLPGIGSGSIHKILVALQKYGCKFKLEPYSIKKGVIQ